MELLGGAVPGGASGLGVARGQGQGWMLRLVGHWGPEATKRGFRVKAVC